MICFRHEAQSALGICKSCGRGLCRACAVELPNGLSCRGTCEERVALLNRIVDRSASSVAAVDAQVRAHAVLSVVFGLLLLGLGVWVYRAVLPILGGFILAFAAIMELYGIARLFPRRRS